MKLDALLEENPALTQEVKKFGLHLQQLLIEADDQDRNFSTELKFMDSSSPPSQFHIFLIKAEGHDWHVTVTTLEASPGKARRVFGVHVGMSNANGDSIDLFAGPDKHSVWNRPPTPELAKQILLKWDKEHEVVD